MKEPLWPNKLRVRSTLSCRTSSFPPSSFTPASASSCISIRTLEDARTARTATARTQRSPLPVADLSSAATAYTVAEGTGAVHASSSSTAAQEAADPSGDGRLARPRRNRDRPRGWRGKRYEKVRVVGELGERDGGQPRDTVEVAELGHVPSAGDR